MGTAVTENRQQGYQVKDQVQQHDNQAQVWLGSLSNPANTIDQQAPRDVLGTATHMHSATVRQSARAREKERETDTVTGRQEGRGDNAQTRRHCCFETGSRGC